MTEGKIYCSFQRDAVTHLNLPINLGDVTIDLDKDTFYLALATGPLDGKGHITHHRDRGISAQAFEFTKSTPLAGTGNI